MHTTTSSQTEKPTLIQVVLYAQAGYYLLTGAWALLDIRSFQKMTGPKVDTWLVKMVGALVVVIGAALALAGRRRALSPEVKLLAIGSALAFTSVDIFYVGRRRISPIYLLDALAELILIAAWVIALGQSGTEPANDHGEHKQATPH